MGPVHYRLTSPPRGAPVKGHQSPHQFASLNELCRPSNFQWSAIKSTQPTQLVLYLYCIINNLVSAFNLDRYLQSVRPFLETAGRAALLSETCLPWSCAGLVWSTDT